MDFPTPRLKGFAIELPNFKYAVNVQDGNKQPVVSANVKVTGISFTETGMTDDRGCYFGAAELHKLYTMIITKSGFATWTHSFVLVLRSELAHPTTQNFPLQVVNSSGAPVSGAAVTITSPKPHSDSGSTGSNGIYEGLVEKDYLNSITITKSGFQTYINDFAHYLKISCLEESMVAIPVITLTV
jgi:hypothetical protein